MRKMSNALDDFKKFYDELQSPEHQQQIAEQQARVQRNINDAAKILSDLRHGRISKDEAIEQAKALYDRTYK